MRGQRRQATHRVVEELLEFLVSVVDTELLKAVQIENFETRNVQNSDETKNICSIKVKSLGCQTSYLAPCLLVRSRDLLILVQIHLKSLS